MKYWFDVHYPRRVDEKQSHYLRVLLKESDRRALREIKEGDWVFIYETTAEKDGFIHFVEDGKKGVADQFNGRKGIVALVKIARSIIKDDCKYGDIPFMGYYLTTKINIERCFISLDEYNKARANAKLNKFIPFSPGELIELEQEEVQLLLGLTKPFST